MQIKVEEGYGVADKPNDGPTSLAVHTGKATNSAVSLTLNPVLDVPRRPDPDTEKTTTPQHGLIVKVQTPKQPENPSLKHVPCDIVLVIDVSYSMSTEAPVPGDKTEEGPYSFSILDLTKHAALTILETMNETDRLGLVTFSRVAEVIQPLTPMTVDAKAQFRESVHKMIPTGNTNLWHGIRDGLGLFPKRNGTETETERVSAMLVLTDGQPNLSNCNSFVRSIRAIGSLPASIHTFGFGYELNSGLLKSIAEVGGGNYAFIPDAGMLGTVFVHAVANLQSTYADQASLSLRYPTHVHIEETTGASVGQIGPVQQSGVTELRIDLNRLQYGQSRDIFLRVNLAPGQVSAVHATLSYSPIGGSAQALDCSVDCRMQGPLPAHEIAYHISRSWVCEFIASIFPLQPTEHHKPLPTIEDTKRDELNGLIDALPAAKYNGRQNKSLMQELQRTGIKGQIIEAVMNANYYKKWGMHFLPSLKNAHEKQICNSFKDPGPLEYGVDSPLFQSCRDRLDHAFDNLDPPPPSIKRQADPPTPSRAGGHGPSHSSSSSSQAAARRSYSAHPKRTMREYRNRDGVCFTSRTPVRLSSGRTVPIRQVRRGMVVETPCGPRHVAAVLKTIVRGHVVCRLNGTMVTPWHPVSVDGKNWEFPARMADAVPARYDGPVYSVMLTQNKKTDAHAIRVGGMWGVTLGHGITWGDDVRAHEFFGDYNRVKRELLAVGMRRGGVVLSSGGRRDEEGRVCGFEPYLGCVPASLGVKGKTGLRKRRVGMGGCL